MSKIKVLVADDEPAVLEIMARKVAAEGFDVVSAKDGQEAWDKIQSEVPDIVLLDLVMPHMDGISVLSHLRANPPSKKWIPVVIISALGETEHLKKAYELKADHYLVKPVRLPDVIKTIHLMVSLIPLRNE
jgi:two-component system KDP operon response regulator KdpE